MEIYLIGYSGHAYVTIESALSAGHKIVGYYETEKKAQNPFKLSYLGSEESIISNEEFGGRQLFVGIGDNIVRASIFNKLKGRDFTNVIDPTANISASAQLDTGIYLGKNVCLNALSRIGKGAIINTGAIIEHECQVGAFSHVAPGAVLCGNVKIGEESFVGANSVIKQGVKIGNNVTIGAGSVILNDVEDNVVAFGNPFRKIK